MDGANLKDADLYQADISGGASLRKANFFGADLMCANLENATIDGATFQFANMPEAILSGVKGVGVDFSFAFMPLAYFSEAEIRDSGVDGTGGFVAATMTGAFFVFDVEFKNVSFSAAWLEATTWNKVALDSVDFSEAVLDASLWRCYDGEIKAMDVTWPEREHEFVQVTGQSCSFGMKMNPGSRSKDDENPEWLAERYGYIKRRLENFRRHNIGRNNADGLHYLLAFRENLANRVGSDSMKFYLTGSADSNCALWRSEWRRRDPSIDSRLLR